MRRFSNCIWLQISHHLYHKLSFFFACVQKHGKAWVQGYLYVQLRLCQYKKPLSLPIYMGAFSLAYTVLPGHDIES